MHDVKKMTVGANNIWLLEPSEYLALKINGKNVLIL